MKTVKRIFAVLLTVCMMMGLSVTAVGAGAGDGAGGTVTSGTLTITNAIPNATYTVYKMLDVVDWTLDETDTDKVTSSVYYLKPDSKWFNFFAKSTSTDGNYAADGVAEFVEVTKIDGDENYYVEWIAMDATDPTKIDDKAAEKFAGLALDYAKDTSHDVTDGVSKKADQPADPSELPSVVFENLPFGYYLVDTNGGAVVALDTHASVQTIEEKNTIPVVQKEVLDGTDWADENSVSIGDTVNFKTEIAVGTGAVDYVLHDAMTTGLTFGEITSVKLKKLVSNDEATGPIYSETLIDLKKFEGDDFNEPAIDSTTQKLKVDGCWRVVASAADKKHMQINGTDEVCDFEIYFNNAIFTKGGFLLVNADGTSYTECEIKCDDIIVVEYTATLNENAVIGKAEGESVEAGNVNKTHVSYGEGSTLTTAPDSTKTYTYKFDLVKTNKKNEVLDNATFELRLADADGNYNADAVAIRFVTTTENGKTSYKVTTEVSGITTITAGSPTITGLGNGTYYLTEITAPDGYKKLADPVEVVIDNANIDATITPATGEGNTATPATWTAGGVQVINVKKSIFPHTGGMGTTIYYLAGGAIIALVAASAVIVFKKRQGGKV